MALDREQLKEDIKAALKAEQEECEDAQASVERIAQKIADAVIKQIKRIDITYTEGLTSQSGGVVSGVFRYSIK
jgi:hypothetical protein|nr:MAG TPA: hypothetical protein [Caudoviricetes sp.]